MSLPRRGRILAIDVGERRHGLALTDPEQTIAQPLATLQQRRGKRFPYVQLEKHLVDVTGILVGLPLEPNGTEGDAARRSRDVAEVVARRSGRPICLRDERHTSALAARAIHEMGGSARGRKGDVDQLAATVLLQGFLEERRCPSE